MFYSILLYFAVHLTDAAGVLPIMMIMFRRTTEYTRKIYIFILFVTEYDLKDMNATIISTKRTNVIEGWILFFLIKKGGWILFNLF